MRNSRGVDAPSVCLRAALALALARTVAAFRSTGAACGGALRPENVVLAPSLGEGGCAATLIELKDVAMFEGENEAERRGKRDDMRDRGAAPGLPRGGGRCQGR